jgi:arylsulfatase A-like enzyme
MCRRLAPILLVLAVVGCGERSERPRRVVLVSIDTLRADHLGFYGYPRPTSPTLDALASESTVFDDAMSASPWTLPSHATLLTGLYPSRHGLVSHERYLPSTIETLAQVFSRAGYRTAAVVNSHNLSPAFGLDRGFQQYRYVEEDAGRREPSREITDQATQWLAAAGDAPVLLFLHYYDVHSDYASLRRYEDELLRPYDGVADGTTSQLVAYREGKLALDPARDAQNLIDRYDAGIRQMDDELGRLLAFLDEKGMSDDTLFLLTSDHGEEFFEHGGVLHGQTQYQEVLHVPLLVRGPGVPRNRRIAAPASLVDVVPTLLALRGMPSPGGLDGVSLVPFWTSGEAKLPDRALFSEADHNDVEDDITRSVRYRGFKLHYNRLTREFRLFDLEHDPEERHDVASEQGAAVAALSERLTRFMAAARAPLEVPQRTLTPDEVEKLRSLGYLR